MGKAAAVLDLFPCPYGIREPRKLLQHVVESLAQPLEEADSHLFRIQRAHRLAVADQIEDIQHLAATLNLTPHHFVDIVADESLEYEEKLRLMRSRVRRVAGLHLDGTGTPWAAVEAAAIFLDATVLANEGEERRLRTLDPDGLSHRATVESDRTGARAPIYLHENPRRRRKLEPADRWPLSAWRLRNESVDRPPVRISVRGVRDRTVRPAVICPDSGQGVLFNGVVPDGTTLLFDERGARLDGFPVDEWVTFFDGGIHDYRDFDDATAVRQHAATAAEPFDLDVRPVASPPVRRPRPVPSVPVGRSSWFLQVDEGVFGGSDFDFAVFDTPPEPVGFYDAEPGFDEAVFYYPPSAVAGMAWNERIPCAFKLTLPPGLGHAPSAEDPAPAWVLGEAVLASSATDSGGDAEAATTTLAPDLGARSDRNVASRISTLLPRFKAAGIRSYVEPTQASWVLGTGTLRGRGARWGQGISTDSTHLADPDRDTLVRV